MSSKSKLADNDNETTDNNNNTPNRSSSSLEGRFYQQNGLVASTNSMGNNFVRDVSELESKQQAESEGRGLGDLVRT